MNACGQLRLFAMLFASVLLAPPTAAEDVLQPRNFKRLPQPDEVGWTFELLVYGQSGDSAARDRLDKLLDLRIESLDRVCSLSVDQKRKLALAGRGDIQRLFDRIEEHKIGLFDTFNPPDANEQPRPAQVEAWQQAILQARPLQTLLKTGPFDDRSLFAKTVRYSLTAEQSAKHEALRETLREIERFGGQVQTMSHGLDQVQELRLIGTAISDNDLLRLNGLPHLQRLNLGRTHVTDAGLAHLKGLSKLESLCLTSTLVGDAGLTHLSGLPNLRELNLIRTQITDTGLLHLCDQKNLLWLYVAQTNVTSTGIAKLQRALPDLIVVK